MTPSITMAATANDIAIEPDPGPATTSPSHADFTASVVRHADWVHAAALRLVRGDVHLAADVTQAVFLLLWRRPDKTAGKPLNAWLFNVTRYCAANALRGETRRLNHERRAASMAREGFNPDSGDDARWADVSPMLEQLVARLRGKDRDVVLQRFYQGRSLAEIGQSLGISADGARKRVATAIDRLRELFEAKGIVASAVGLITMLEAHTTHTAPPLLVNALTATPTAGGTGAAARIAAGVRRTMATWKLGIAAAAISAGSLAAAGGWLALRGQGIAPPPVSLPVVIAANASAAPTAAPAAPINAAPATAPTIDLSTPEHTMGSLLAALQAGDRDLTYQCLTADPHRAPLPIDAFFDAELSANRAVQAVAAHFGPEAQAQMQRGMATVAMVGAIFARNSELAPGGKDVDNDDAQLAMTIPEALLGVLPPNIQFVARQWSGAPAHFKRVNGQWRLDLDRTCKVVRFTGDPMAPGGPALAGADERNTAGLEELAKRADQFAADVRAGKFATLTDARRAMNRLRNVPNAGQLMMLPAAYTPKAKGEVGF